MDALEAARRGRIGWLACAVAMLSLGACQGARDPFALDDHLDLQEDESRYGVVVAVSEATSLTYTVAVPPEHGEVLLDEATGEYTYRPEADYHGPDRFQFKASDGVRTSQPATVSLAVAPVNDAPEAWDQAVALDEDSARAGQIVATDVDGDLLTFTVTSGPKHGTLVLDGVSGIFSYTPDADYHGPDGFRFTASDGVLDSNEAAVTLTVAPVNDPPVAEAPSVTGDEDTLFDGQVVASDVDGDALSYTISSQPGHGAVILDPATGAYAYQPAQDFNGPDSFQVTVSDGALAAQATIWLVVNPVNDAPVLPAIPDQGNSAEVRESFVALPLRDVDGDLVRYAVSVSDPAVADAAVDGTGTLVVTPRGRGVARVSLLASDGLLQVGGSFLYSVTEVTKLRRFDVPVPREQAITIVNTSDREVAFELRHNGHQLATTGEQLVQEVRDLPDEVPGEPFERKLWRFVRDGSYDFDPLTAAAWQHDPLLFLNSVGFGFCDDVTAVYVILARAAGFEARGWDLYGHVIPEIHVKGRWEVYDPSLAAYYLTASGAVAGVADLAADPTLFSSPIAPVTRWALPYSAMVEDFYSTNDDNVLVWPGFYQAPKDVRATLLPPRSRVTYPGLWAAAPTTVYEKIQGTTAQLKLDLPKGFVGVVDWPLVTWDVQGVGRVRLGGIEYQAGSPELTSVLQDVRPDRGPSLGIEFLEAVTPVSVVYMLNPVRFGMTESASVSLRSIDAWALEPSLVALPIEDRVGYDSLDAMVRPH